jgi:hypothetical protein
MNRKFFGDTRDLFKLDLVCNIMKNLPELDSFTFVPMLTEDDETKGQKKNAKKDLAQAVKNGKGGSKNMELVLHMARLQEIDNDLEYFRGIRSLFKKENIMIDIFDRHKFSHAQREHYFASLFEKFPTKSLIFLDPDIGLEERKPSKKHLLFYEVKKIHDRMDNHSIMMIYQHFPRKPHNEYIKFRCSQLNQLTGQDPVTITDNEIVFFLITKNPVLKRKIGAVLGEYMSHYPVLSAHGEL